MLIITVLLVLYILNTAFNYSAAVADWNASFKRWGIFPSGMELFYTYFLCVLISLFSLLSTILLYFNLLDGFKHGFDWKLRNPLV